MSPILRAVNFKEVWTTNVRTLYVNPEWTVEQFINNIKLKILCEFNISHLYDIIETGQALAENAPALQCSNIKLKDKWNDNLDVSFYVRKTPYTQEYIYVLDCQPDECPVCLETVQLISRHGCSHRICANCNEQCQQVNYTICPVCRHY